MRKWLMRSSVLEDRRRFVPTKSREYGLLTDITTYLLRNGHDYEGFVLEEIMSIFQEQACYILSSVADYDLPSYLDKFCVREVTNDERYKIAEIETLGIPTEI